MKFKAALKSAALLRRSPRGERGLKFAAERATAAFCGRSPRGERGLKSIPLPVFNALRRSLPSRGAWVEMMRVRNTCLKPLVAPLAGSVG